MRGRAFILATLLILVPLSARSRRPRRVVGGGRQFVRTRRSGRSSAPSSRPGKQVELTLHPRSRIFRTDSGGAGSRQPPDFAFSLRFGSDISPLAFDDRLVDLTDTIGPFGPVRSRRARLGVLLNEKTGQRKLYALPMGRTTNHIHVWKTLLEQAGFTL